MFESDQLLLARGRPPNFGGRDRVLEVTEEIIMAVMDASTPAQSQAAEARLRQVSEAAFAVRRSLDPRPLGRPRAVPPRLSSARAGGAESDAQRCASEAASPALLFGLPP
jgi:hypothetical protein